MSGPIVSLSARHLPQLESLLQNNQLPSDDCAAQRDIFYGIFDQDRLVAAGGLEIAANDALLRSLVVAQNYRGRGLAGDICNFLLDRAQAEQCDAVYLLTESAAGYFERIGFSRLPRSQAPAAISTTRQFSSLCPDSASFLMLRLPRSARGGL